jgi:hypothetical protein
LRAARLINELRIAGKYDVILDNPLETGEDMAKTIEVLSNTPKPFLMEPYSLTLYPGTELYEKMSSRGPAPIEDYRKKNYLKYDITELNRLITLAVYIPAGMMRIIMLWRKKGSGALLFKTAFAVLQTLSALYYKPLALLKVFVLSNGNSLIRSFVNCPIYIEGIFEKKF